MTHREFLFPSLATARLVKEISRPHFFKWQDWANPIIIVGFDQWIMVLLGYSYYGTLKQSYTLPPTTTLVFLLSKQALSSVQALNSNVIPACFLFTVLKCPIRASRLENETNFLVRAYSLNKHTRVYEIGCKWSEVEYGTVTNFSSKNFSKEPVSPLDSNVSLLFLTVGTRSSRRSIGGLSLSPMSMSITGPPTAIPVAVGNQQSMYIQSREKLYIRFSFFESRIGVFWEDASYLESKLLREESVGSKVL